MIPRLPIEIRPSVSVSYQKAQSLIAGAFALVSFLVARWLYTKSRGQLADVLRMTTAQLEQRFPDELRLGPERIAARQFAALRLPAKRGDAEARAYLLQETVEDHC